MQLTVWDGVTADLVAEARDGLAGLVEGGLAGVRRSLVGDLCGEELAYEEGEHGE